MMNKTILIFIVIASVIVASCVTAMAEQLPSRVLSMTVDELITDGNIKSRYIADIRGVVIDFGTFFSSNKKRIMFSDIQLDDCDVMRYKYFPPTSASERKIVFYCR